MRSFRPSVGVLLVVVLLVLIVGPAQAAGGKWVIEVKNKPKSNGEIVFGFTPSGGEQQEIRVTVQSKMNAKDLAKDVAKEFTVALGDGYKVGKSGDRKVSIKTRTKKATFDIVITSQTVTGLSVVLK